MKGNSTRREANVFGESSSESAMREKLRREEKMLPDLV
jgi:hypothetical protein